MAKPARERDIEEDRDDVEVDPKETKENTLLVDGEEDDDEGADNATAKRQQRRENEGEDDEEQTDARLAYDEDDEDGGPQERDSRRKRRNRARREAQQQSQAVIQAMAQEMASLKAQLGQVMRGQVGLAAGDIDSQITMLQGEIDKIDEAMERAITEANGATYTKGQRLRDEARDRLQALAYEKQRLAQHLDPRRQQQQQQGPAAPQGDPVAQRLATRFMERHPDFDPDDPSHEESMIVKAIDDALANEGYKPNDKRTWVELERRVRARGIDLGQNQDRGVDVNDERDTTPPRRDTGGLPPRSGRGTSGAGAGRTVTLPAFARETLEEMGLLDTKGLTKEQLAKRSSYVSQWSKGLKEAAATGGRR